MATALLVAALAAGCRVGEARIDYGAVADELPDLSDLPARATAFRSTLIYDREGNLLNEAFHPDAGRRTVVALDRISPHLKLATIATEDARYYEHGGVDPVAVARAAWYLVREGEAVSGASTIPQQLVKRLYLDPERSVRRKVVEAALAAEISKRYGKDEILELYLNEIYYGNLAYGAQAAARTYFGKDAADLTLAEAALLAGLPQAPAYYDPYANPERAKRRQATVLRLMAESGAIRGSDAEAAAAEALAYVPQRFELRAPHFTLLVREQVEALLGPEALYSRGLVVATTLDPRLQDLAETAVRDHVSGLAGAGATNGALVAIRPVTGEVLAMVGSADYDDQAISGNVNMAVAPRQPGSAFKPLVYLAALESGELYEGQSWSPGTLLADIESDFPDGANPSYRPTNYDLEEHGLVTMRDALANSYNIPAVRTLAAVGIPDVLSLARRTGISTLTRPDYGLALALGSGEVPLLELAGAYAVLANGGRRLTPATITRITDGDGDVLCRIGTDRPCAAGQVGVARQQVVRPADAFLVTDMLSDNAARAPAFGSGSYLEIDRPAAVKTGTTNDTRDGWTVGYVPQLVAGVWVGNADNTPMAGVSGYRAAAPIWNRFMRSALAGDAALPFPEPEGVRAFEVCVDTGALPSTACPRRAWQWFSQDRPPAPVERDPWRLYLDFPYKVYPDRYRGWAESHGIPQPPPGWDDEVPTVSAPTRKATPSPSATIGVTMTLTTTATAVTPTMEATPLATPSSGPTSMESTSTDPPTESPGTAAPPPPPSTSMPPETPAVPTHERPATAPPPATEPPPTPEPPTTSRGSG